MLSKIGRSYITTINQGKGFKIPQIYGGPESNYGKEVESRMTTLQRERQNFLLLLQKQFPGEIFCYYCQIIHSPDKTETEKIGKTGNAGLFGKTVKSALLSRPCSKAKMAHNPYYKRFNFSQVQLAMKRHHLGLDPSNQLNKLSRTSSAEFKGDHTYLLTSNARIFFGHLWLRSQHWILLPKNKLKWPTLRQRIPICCHWTEDDLYNGKIDPIACRVAHKLNFACEDCVGMHSCDKCATEIQIDTKKVEGRHAVVVTVWKDFGVGETPFDPAWMSHWENLWHVYYHDFAFLPPGNIKRIFEDGKDFIFDAHLPEDMQRSLNIKSSDPRRREYKNF